MRRLLRSDASLIIDWNIGLYNPVILYDGFCNLCTSSVAFVLRHDVVGRFKFLALQTEKAKYLRRDCEQSQPVGETILLIFEGKCYSQSDAILRIFKLLPGFWPILSWLRVFPKPLRDRIYAFIARNRFSWFGRREACMLSIDGYQDRFLTEND